MVIKIEKVELMKKVEYSKDVHYKNCSYWDRDVGSVKHWNFWSISKNEDWFRKSEKIGIGTKKSPRKKGTKKGQKKGKKRDKKKFFKRPKKTHF